MTVSTASPDGTPRPALATSPDQKDSDELKPAALGLPTAKRPVGIINEQNTCFLNSTFQALGATRPLISLLTHSSTSSLEPSSSLPPPIFPPDRVPALRPSAFEPPLYDLLPVTRAFLNNLHKAWKAKEAAAPDSKSISLRSLLRELARKYDQYDDYRQQDSHELLRHLLDSMEMEEKDIIKRIQPSTLLPRKSTADGPVVPEEERLVPFVDVLFGGSLASVVVCEKCKAVSHTYEGFLDISLSLKGDEPRERKRDKFKALFRPKRPSNSGPNINETVNHLVTSPAVLSDTELSDSERPKSARDRRLSLDQDDRSDSGNLSRASSLKSLGFKPGLFRKRGSRPGSSTSLPVEEAPPAVPSPRNTSSTNGPTAAQMAYIQRILTQTPDDAMAKLKSAEEPAEPQEYGLLESLRQFTSVELLEGDNAFACKKCWRVASGRYAPPSVKEEEEEEAIRSTPLLSLRRATAPSISIHSESSSEHRTGLRAPSPLRQADSSIGDSDISFDSHSAHSHTVPDDDGLSDTSSDEEPPSLPVGRPHMPPRKKSTHFVMRRAFKRYLIAKPPEILVFHLKRFRQTHKNGAFTTFYDLKKIDDFVSFPETLDLNPFLAPNRSDYTQGPRLRAPYLDWPSEHGPDQTPVPYRLYAIVVHLGTMIGGHYVAYTLVDPENMFEDAAQVTEAIKEMQIDDRTPIPSNRSDRKRVWCYCSDTTVRLASLDEVLNCKAYICFYEKI